MLPEEWYGEQSPLSFGCVIGACIITDCILVDCDPPEPGTPHYRQLQSILEAYEAGWVNGPYCFTLDDPMLFAHPVPYTANTGIRPLPDAHLLLHHDDLLALRKKYGL